jgi:hypothetical protein
MRHQTRILYGSHQATVKKAIFSSGALVFLEAVGQEASLRAITAVIMQGRNRQGDNRLSCDEREYFEVFPRGNRRLIDQIGEGFAHTIVFNDCVLPKPELMGVLVGNDDEGLFGSFQGFLEVAVPLPRLTALDSSGVAEKELFETLKMGDYLTPCLTIGEEKESIKALRIDKEKLFLDDYLALRTAMIATAKKLGFPRNAANGNLFSEVVKKAA